MSRELKPTFQKAKRVIETYPFSVVWIQEQSLPDAITIFQRINQSGKPLSRYDLVCANLWTNDFDFRKRVATLNEKFDTDGFGAIDETIYTQSFALILQDKCTTLAELSLETETVSRSWERVIRSLSLAVDFASSNLGVKRAGYLPYRGILPVLAYVFNHLRNSSISAEVRQLLWEWFWRVSLSERYSSASPSRMAEDALKLRDAINGEDVVFDYPSRVTSDSVLRVKMTQTSSALRNAILCMLALRKPRNFKDGSDVNLWDPFFSDLKKAERHHIFPVGFLKEEGISDQVHQVGNFCFIPADLNKEIGKLSPKEYLNKFKRLNPHIDIALRSHLLSTNEDSPLWENDFQSFLKDRSDAISKELNRMLGIEASEIISAVETIDDLKYENLVDVTEIRIRDFIDDRLLAVVGDTYWNLCIPGDIIAMVRKRIEEVLRQQPYRTRNEFVSPRKRLNYCDVSDYKKIIMVNWDVFEEVFRSKSELDKHLDGLRRFRNCVKHHREPTELELAEGELAIMWIQQTLDRYVSDLNGLIEEQEDEIEIVDEIL